MRTVFSFVVLSALLMACVPAYAQDPVSTRPYRGLFGGSNPVQQGLRINGAFGGGYNQRRMVIDSQGGPADPDTVRSTSSATASGGASYGVSTGLFTLAASASSSSWYNQGRSRPWTSNYNASVSGATQFDLTSRTNVTVNGSASYRPVYLFSALPALAQEGIAAGAFDQLDGDATVRHLTSGAVGAGIRQTLTTRAFLSADYGYNRGLSPFGVGDTDYQRANARFTFMLAKGLGAYAGYSRNDGLYNGGALYGRRRVRTDSIDAGVNVNRRLSISRNMTLGLSSGLAGTTYDGVKRYRLVGDASLTREIGRSWSADLRYARNVEVLYSFQQPVTWDSLSTGVSGMLGRRGGLQFRGGASTGAVGLQQTSNGFNNAYGRASLTIGLARQLGFSLDYAYTRYKFGAAVQLPTGLLRQVNRQTLLANVNVWLPIPDRSRRSNASR
jgi:hypothetical protein